MERCEWGQNTLLILYQFRYYLSHLICQHCMLFPGLNCPQIPSFVLLSAPIIYMGWILQSAILRLANICFHLSSANRQTSRVLHPGERNSQFFSLLCIKSFPFNSYIFPMVPAPIRLIHMASDPIETNTFYVANYWIPNCPMFSFSVIFATNFFCFKYLSWFLFSWQSLTITCAANNSDRFSSIKLHHIPG